MSAEDFLCPICHSLLNEPKQTPCGHLFCSHCVNEWLSSSNTCPVCHSADMQLSKLVNPPLVLLALIKSLQQKPVAALVVGEAPTAMREPEGGTGRAITTIQSTLLHQQSSIAQERNRNDGQDDVIKRLTNIVDEQAEKISRQTTEICTLQMSLLQLQAITVPQLYAQQFVLLPPQSLQVPPRSIDWVVRGIQSKWSAGFEEFSPELCFQHVPESNLRYTFKINIAVNSDISIDHVGVYFVPRRGPTHKSLQWPIKHQLKLEILNLHGKSNKSDVLGETHATSCKKFFANHSPPAEDNKLSRGHSKFLTRDEVDSGDYVKNDAMIVRVTLLDATL